jgi:hypothetical protein
MLQGPPQTGKTGVLQLAYKRARNSGLFRKVIFVSAAAPCDGGLDSLLAPHDTNMKQLFQQFPAEGKYQACDGHDTPLQTTERPVLLQGPACP